MAVVLVEGWDHLAVAQITTKGWSSAPTSMQAGRFDGQCARFGNATLRSKSLPASLATVIVGFAYQATTNSSTTLMFAIRASTTNTLTLNTDATGHLQVKNSGGTTIATGTTVLNASTWYYIEVKLFVNAGTPASGTCEVHLNGVTEIASTTGNFGSTSIDNIAFQQGNASTDIDDVYVVDTAGSAPRNTFLGDVRVETIYPNGAGNHSDWTPDTGVTHYTRVNETTADGDTSYVSDSTPGHIDTYTFGDIDGAATVYAVQTNLYARKDDANARQIAPLIRQSTTDYPGTTVTLTASYVDYTQIYNQDPTNSDWTAANVNSDEFGVKEIA